MAGGFRVDVGLQSVRVESDELLCVVGPTASQKTELAIRICERVDGEVISADSVQIYEGFDIGSGKPSTEQLQRVAHHLIGTASALEPVDAAHFALEAQRLVDEIRSRGRVPVVCGGTFMWVRALVYGLASAPKGDACVREALDQRMHEHGSRAMHQQLAKVDPVTASRLHPHDWVRIQRALEVFELTGKPLSQWHAASAAATEAPSKACGSSICTARSGRSSASPCRGLDSRRVDRRGARPHRQGV